MARGVRGGGRVGCWDILWRKRRPTSTGSAGTLGSLQPLIVASPNMAQSHVLLGPGGGGAEAATGQATAPSVARSQAHRAFPSEPERLLPTQVPPRTGTRSGLVYDGGSL